MNRNSIARLAFIALFAACIAYALTCVSAQEASQASPLQWQHLALTHNGLDVAHDKALARRITDLGDDGWELVTVSTVIRNGTTEQTNFYFKKRR